MKNTGLFCPVFLHMEGFNSVSLRAYMGSPQRRMVFAGRGGAKPQVKFAQDTTFHFPYTEVDLQVMGQGKLSLHHICLITLIIIDIKIIHIKQAEKPLLKQQLHCHHSFESL